MICLHGREHQRLRLRRSFDLQASELLAGKTVYEKKLRLPFGPQLFTLRSLSVNDPSVRPHDPSRRTRATSLGASAVQTAKEREQARLHRHTLSNEEEEQASEDEPLTLNRRAIEAGRRIGSYRMPLSVRIDLFAKENGQKVHIRRLTRAGEALSMDVRKLYVVAQVYGTVASTARVHNIDLDFCVEKVDMSDDSSDADGELPPQDVPASAKGYRNFTLTSRDDKLFPPIIKRKRALAPVGEDLRPGETRFLSRPP